jgi:hypothetical protein
VPALTERDTPRTSRAKVGGQVLAQACRYSDVFDCRASANGFWQRFRSESKHLKITWRLTRASTHVLLIY